MTTIAIGTAPRTTPIASIRPKPIDAMTTARVRVIGFLRRPRPHCVPLKVSQALMLPVLTPVWNQRTRCAEVPCVKLSGTT